MSTFTHMPARPLITHDPYFSIWDCGSLPTTDDTRHWSGAEKPLRGNIVIDGVRRRFLGRTGGSSLALKDVQVTPLSTRYIFEELGVRLTVKFTSPLLPDDFDILSTPISYVNFDLDFVDGKEHNVILRLTALEGMCCSGEVPPKMRSDVFSADGLQYAYMGQARQKPLSGSGDHLTIDWGYMFYSTSDGELDTGAESGGTYLCYVKKSEKPFHTTLMVGYDDVASINYFGRMLPAYYARNGKTITQALAGFHARQDEILSRCAAFDEKLLADAAALGGEDYALIVSASYRQSVAAHKLVEAPDGELLFISKENDSNGCAGTVDVSYPSIPLYLLYAPELVRAMCRPVLKFARMPVWHYDFAPHDVGRYPIVNGQIYAASSATTRKVHSCGDTIAPYYLYPATVDVYNFESQMPVEESANMLLMLAAAGYADGDYALAERDLDLLRQWCRYLLDFGEDPGDQLCTDDFAGHLARNVNLSAKAVMGVAAFARILEALGYGEEAAGYREKAKQMGESWLRRADVGGYTSLTYSGDGWSQKYNLVWDKLLGLNILPDSFYRQEIASYLPRINEYGLPLDSRSVYTKSDWTMWVAAMAEDRQTLDRFTAPLAKFLRETPCRVPFSDFYDTCLGTAEEFIGRSVQGGNFMPLLMQAWKK